MIVNLFPKSTIPKKPRKKKKPTLKDVFILKSKDKKRKNKRKGY